MRAGSLSNDKVIELLNRYFVPVYVSNEDYWAKDGSAPIEEKKELQRIYHATLKAKMSAGSVHVYIVDPHGNPVDSMHVAKAYDPKNLAPMLEKVVATLGTKDGKPLVESCCQSAKPQAGKGDLILHLVGRNLVQQGKELVPAQARLGVASAANWGSYPVENWVLLTPPQQRKLLGDSRVQEGAAWDLDPDASARFLIHFYPSTENNDVTKNRIEKSGLRATVAAQEDRLVRVLLNGHFTMKHWFYHKDDGNRVEATLAGYLDFEPRTGRIMALRLVTTQARYARMHFGVVLRSVSN